MTVNLIKQDKYSPDRQREKVPLNGSVNDVFNTTVDGTFPMRIVMVGEAGRGKTTAVAKMAYDWANRVDNSPLTDVPLLFVLKMRQIDRNTSLVQAIISQLLGKKFSKEGSALMDYIQKHEEHVVIIFDGYDEFDGSVLSERNQSDVIDILKYETCRECRVLLTTRPVREKDFDDRNINIVYAKLEIHGFSHAYVNHYIDNFF